jgi:hypothetical protein
MVIELEDGNTPSGSPTPTPRNSDGEDEIPLEITERNLSDGFLQVATEIEHITDEDVEPTPNLLKRILLCLARLLSAFFK